MGRAQTSAGIQWDGNWVDRGLQEREEGRGAYVYDLEDGEAIPLTQI